MCCCSRVYGHDICCASVHTICLCFKMNHRFVTSGLQYHLAFTIKQMPLCSCIKKFVLLMTAGVAISNAYYFSVTLHIKFNEIICFRDFTPFFIYNTNINHRCILSICQHGGFIRADNNLNRLACCFNFALNFLPLFKCNSLQSTGSIIYHPV